MVKCICLNIADRRDDFMKKSRLYMLKNTQKVGI